MELERSTKRFVVLKGNHEDMMVVALRGNFPVFERWLTFGGRETLLSFSVDAAAIDRVASLELLQTATEAVGPAVLNWLAALPLTCRYENYLFVHAGIRPGRKLSRQVPDDLLWIADTFLKLKNDHGVTVVHGHSIHAAGADIQPNRIEIDTGAFRTGRLTALGLERGDVWTLMTDTRTQPDAGKARARSPDDDYYARMVSPTRAACGSDI